MSQQGPIVTVSNREGRTLADAIAQVKTFPLVDVGWPDAVEALARLRPAAVLASDVDGNKTALAVLARQAARAEPYLPLIALDPGASLPQTALPFTQAGRSPDPAQAAEAGCAAADRSPHAARCAEAPEATWCAER